MTVLVFASNQRNLVKLCRDVRKNGYKAGSIVISPKIEEFGYADIVWFIPYSNDASLTPEYYAKKTAIFVEKENPRYLLIEPAMLGNKFAKHLASILGISMITDISQITGGEKIFYINKNVTVHIH